MTARLYSQLWTLSKLPHRRLVKLATGPVLFGISVVNSRTYYGISFDDVIRVRCPVRPNIALG